MQIIEYDERYKQDFIDFNSTWIIDNFGHLEPEDFETFEKIDEELKEGAMIYFAVDDNGTALATCMAKPMDGDTWEICKLGSNKNVPHKGAGSAVFEAAMKWATDHGAGSGYSDAAKPPIRRNGNRPSGGRKPQVLVNAAEPLVRCGVSHQSGQT